MSDIVTFRLDANLKAELTKVVNEFGMKPSEFFRLITKQVIDTRSLPLNFDARKVPNATTIAAIEAIERGEVEVFDTPEQVTQALLNG